MSIKIFNGYKLPVLSFEQMIKFATDFKFKIRPIMELKLQKHLSNEISFYLDDNIDSLGKEDSPVKQSPVISVWMEYCKQLDQMQIDKKRNPLSNIKSKSHDNGLGNYLSRSRYNYLTENRDEFFGFEAAQEIIWIHIEAIHTRAETFSKSSPKELDYAVFKNQLEFTRVHAEKIVQKTQASFSSSLCFILCLTYLSRHGAYKISIETPCQDFDTLIYYE